MSTNEDPSFEERRRFEAAMAKREPLHHVKHRCINGSGVTKWRAVMTPEGLRSVPECTAACACTCVGCWAPIRKD